MRPGALCLGSLFQELAAFEDCPNLDPIRHPPGGLVLRLPGLAGGGLRLVACMIQRVGQCHGVLLMIRITGVGAAARLN